MTETKEKDKAATGIPGVKPATADQLPEEEKFQVSTDTPGLYGDFTEDRIQAQAQQQEATKVFDESENAIEWFQKKTTEGFKYWAQFTHFDIKMDDGKTVRYYRVPLKKYEADELLDLSAEVQSRRSLETDQPMTAGQVRIKEKLLDQLKAKYYLRNAKTNKPMGVDELKHVNDSTIIDSILEACLAITLAKWAEGKK